MADNYTNHGWTIRATTTAIEDLFAACTNIPIKIGDMEIDQNVFVQEEISHPVILGQPNGLKDGAGQWR